METVTKVVDAGYKVIWGEDNSQQAPATGSTTASNQSGLDYVVDAGKKALWGSTTTDDASSEQQKTPHGEEPVSGEQGLGTAMDPYDAGNKEEEDAVPNSHVTTEQRNVETSHGASSAAAASAEPDMLKTTVTGLQQDPSQPSNNPTDSASRVIVDKGPGQSLKHTSGPFQKESDKLVGDLQGKNTLPETKAFETAPAVAIPSAVPAPSSAAIADEPASKLSKEEDTSQEDVSKSSFSGTSSSDASGSDRKEKQRKKTSKLEKVKNKLHIGSPKSK